MTTKPTEQTTATHPANASAKPTPKNGDTVRDATKKLDRALEGLTTEEKARALAAVSMLHGFLDEAAVFVGAARAAGAQL